MTKLNDANAVMCHIEKQLGLLGIKVADSSVYQGGANNKNRQIIVVVGYMPDRACIFTVHASFEKSPYGNNYKFDITGQLENLERLIKRWGPVSRGFPDVPRFMMNYESYGTADDTTFCINHSVTNDAVLSERIGAGMNFYRNFLEKYKDALMGRFTKPIHPWFVPEYSDKLEKLEAKNGRFNSENYRPFNARVLAKFPRGLLAEDQKP